MAPIRNIDDHKQSFKNRNDESPHSECISVTSIDAHANRGKLLRKLGRDVTSILQGLKVACVGTSQSMHSLEMNKASLETSFTKKQRDPVPPFPQRGLAYAI